MKVLVVFCAFLVGSAFALTKDEIAQFAARPYTNANTNLQGTVKIADNTKGKLIITSNGIPDHPTGVFDGTRPPNEIEPQNNRWTVKRNPTFAKTTSCLPMGPIGVGINGVAMYNPFSGGCCDAGEAELNLFDSCWGHPSPDGTYHYHTAPLCLFKTVCNQPSTIVGVAFDGFPIYGPIDEDGTQLFSADLDECHGKTASDGSYRYHITSDYPYMLGCFKGTVLADSGMKPTNCNCDIDNPVEPCTEFENNNKPPPPWLRSAIERRDKPLLNMMLGLKAEGGFECCADADDCDYVSNVNSSMPDA